MNYYKLRVTKQEDNPQYEAQRKEYDEKQNRYGFNGINQPEQPQKLITTDILDVVLTDEQFEAIRKSVLETYK